MKDKYKGLYKEMYIEEHISFEILSDLHDNELSESSKSEVLIYLEGCEHCRKEFETLEQMIKLIALASDVKFSDAFSFNIIKAFQKRNEIKKIKAQKRRRRALYFAPVAAAIVAILGVTLFLYEKNPNVQNIAQIEPPKPVVQQARPRVRPVDNRLNETQRIISVISDSNARILNIFENSIEGEIYEEEFTALKNSLENRRVVYYKVRPNEHFEMNRWAGGFETVAFSDSYGFDDDDDSPPVIRFKIYKN